MQSGCILFPNNFAPVKLSGKLDKTTLAMILAHWLHYVKTRRHPQNIKFCQRTDRQTDRHADRNNIHPSRG